MSTLLDSGQVIKASFDETNQALKVVSVAGDFNIEITANNYTHINSNTTTVVKASAGVLAYISINLAGVTGNTATIYDNTAASGTVIAVIDTTSSRTLSYNVAFTTGLTIVTATGTAADVTVAYL